MTKEKTKKIVNTVLNVLSYIFFALCLVALVLSVGAKRDPDGSVTIFGMQMRVVLSDSMAAYEGTDVSEYDIKDIPVKSLVFTKVIPDDPEEAEKFYKELKVGDVLTFKYLYVTQETITHRIVDKQDKPGGGYYIYLDGDNKASEDSETMQQIIDTTAIDSPNYIIGKVVSVSYPLGLLVTAVTSPIGIVCIIIIPCFIIAIFEIIRLVGALNESKKKKEKEEKQKRDAEFEEMKRQLEELKKNSSPHPEAAAAEETEPEETATEETKAENTDDKKSQEGDKD